MEHEFRQDFPLLGDVLENGGPLAYLDNAATTQKPRAVIDAVQDYYLHKTANPHRGAYTLSANATAVYENAREHAARFIGAASGDEIIFTRNATDALNLVALSWTARLHAGDEILISVSEHHSNLLPWQSLAKRTGAVLQYLDTDKNGLVSVEELGSKLTSRTKLVAVTQISNVLGSLNPIRELAAAAHAEGAIFVMDGAQSVPHIPVDVRELDVDFMAFSGHKMLAPEGIGVLYGKRERLEAMEPVILGGGIVEEVTRQSVRLLDGPQRFEPGTPNVAAAAGLDAAMDYLERAGFDWIAAIELELTAYLMDGLSQISGAQVYGSPSPEMHRGIVAFNLEGVHPHDVATFLDADGVAVRAGHHCAQPLMGHLGISSCCRASLYLYNTRADVEQCIQALEKVRRWFS